MKLGGSLGNVPLKLKKLDIFWTVSQRVQFILYLYKLYSWKWSNSLKYIELL
jgi:hypothetical protein